MINIKFKGQAYKTITELVAAWNADNPQIFQSNFINVKQNLKNWGKKHPGFQPTDKIIENALTPRSAKHAIQYKGKWYNGPSAVYNALGKLAELPFKSFFANLQAWRNKNFKRTVTDEKIESFAKRKRYRTNDGRLVGIIKLAWEGLPEPKLGWGRFTQKLRFFRRNKNRNPINKEIQKLATPEEWMERPKISSFLSSTGRVFTIKRLYNSLEGRKCSFSAFRHRVAAFKKRTGKKPTLDEIRVFVAPWSVADRSIGILYRWTHKKNGKVYIGITTQSFEERTRGHLRQAEEGPWPKGGLHEAIARDGPKAFTVDKIAEYDNLEKLIAAEQDAVKGNNSLVPNGFNLDEGGKGITAKMLPLQFRGRSYKNLTALAHDYGIPIKRLDSRLRIGWSLEDAVNHPGKVFGRASNPYNLKENESIRTIAKKYGIPYRKVYARLEIGWTLDEALEIKPRKFIHARAKQIKVAGKTFRSHAKAAEYFKVAYGTWRKRLKLGWSLNQTAGLKPLSNRKAKGDSDLFRRNKSA